MSPPRQIIWDAAGQHGIDDGLIWIPLTISWGESSWKVDAGGDGGESIGLFQINDIHGISKENRMDGVYNANWIMPQMKRFIDKGVEKGLKGEELLKYVWYNVEKPRGYNSNYALGYDPNTTDPEALTGMENMESAYQAASSGTIDVRGKGPLEYHGLGGGTSTGDVDDLLDDPLTQANIDYLDAQTKYLKDNFGLSFAQFQQAKLEFQATLSLSTDQFEEGKRQFEKTFGLSLLQFFEAQNQFDKTFALAEDKFAYQKESDFANLSARLLETSMTDRRAAAQQQTELFKTLQPFMVDKEGKIAASIGRKFRGITGGGSMPTMRTPYDPTLSQPADMDAMTQSAQEQALRFMAGYGGDTDEPAATGTQPTPEQIALAAQMGIRVEDLMASLLKTDHGAVVRMPTGGTVSPSSPHWSDTRPVGAGVAGKSFQIKPKQSIGLQGKMRRPFEGWNTIPTGYASGGTITPAAPKGGYGTFNTEKTGLETYLDGMDKIVQGPGGGGSAGVALPGDGIPSMNKVRNTFGQRKGLGVPTRGGQAGAGLTGGQAAGGLFAGLAGQ